MCAPAHTHVDRQKLSRAQRGTPSMDTLCRHYFHHRLQRCPLVRDLFSVRLCHLWLLTWAALLTYLSHAWGGVLHLIFFISFSVSLQTITTHICILKVKSLCFRVQALIKNRFLLLPSFFQGIFPCNLPRLSVRIITVIDGFGGRAERRLL